MFDRIKNAYEEYKLEGEAMNYRNNVFHFFYLYFFTDTYWFYTSDTYKKH